MNVNASKQRGAALVEFAFTFMVFLLFIFAIIEGAIIIFRWEAANEAVRAGVRTAIVSSLPDDKAIGDVLTSCPGQAPVSYNCGSYNGSCDKIVQEMQNFSPLVTSESVTVIYSCSKATNTKDGRIIPMVTVKLDAQYKSILLGAFGIDATIPLLDTVFHSTRVAEDLYNR